jgi:hypothetical protein
VERNIQSTGAAPFKIKNSTGNEVKRGQPRDQLVKITDHFNIDVDNPIVVMTQAGSQRLMDSARHVTKRILHTRLLSLMASCDSLNPHFLS